MKLKNKKTGEMVDWDGVHISTDNDGEMFDSLAELNEEWEDYEPLIKDEKIRKAVRAWAEANKVESAFVTMDENIDWSVYGDDIDRNRFRIQFFDRVVPDENMDHHYTIEELCGEEDGN